ncbi:unnamed protein product, partial [Heterosigma akashiwo]
MRSFNPKFLDKFSWARYSALKNAVFCLPCLLFGRSSSSKLCSDEGYQNFKNVGATLDNHCK